MAMLQQDARKEDHFPGTTKMVAARRRLREQANGVCSPYKRAPLRVAAKRRGLRSAFP